jgi:hypothetical protein
MAQYSEEWFYPTGQLATNQRAIVFGPGDDNVVAPIFSDPAMTVPLANPTVTDANGMLTFYAADGTYWIWVGPTTGGNGIEITLGASPDNPVLSVNGIAPDGGGNVELTAADVDAQPITTINALGDLYIGTGDNATTRLPIGSAGEVLTVVGGTASWEPGGGGAVDSVNGQTGVVVLGAADVGAQPIATIDALGDLYVGTGDNATTRLPRGADGEVLATNSAQPGGLEWIPAPGGAVDSVNGQTGVVVLTAADVGAAPTTRNINTTNGLTGGGDLSADRTIEPVYGTTANTVAEGDDSRITGAQQRSTLTTLGDIYVATGPGTVTRFGVGSDSQVLIADSGEPTGLNWDTLDATDVGAIPNSIIDAKGDLIVGLSNDTPTRQAVGANGTVLSADSGETTGVEWRALTTDDTIEFTDDRLVLTAGNGTMRWYNRTASELTLVGAWVSAGVIPTGADIIVDVNKNGTTIYSTQANRPTVPATTNGGAISATPDVTSFAVGDYLTVDIDQIGSTIAGGAITVGIVVRRTL